MDLTEKYNQLIKALLEIEPDFVVERSWGISATYGDYFLSLEKQTKNIDDRYLTVVVKAKFQFDGDRKEAPVFVLHCNDAFALKSVEVDSELGCQLYEKLLQAKGDAAQTWAIDKFLEGLE